ncbi:Seipin family [Dillenia turbinata]|uniref:Seipin family n=1 Tax=Dillenia turbinata TaxID=194707 RepID=A0AAN8URG0_9MAGN
MEEPETNAKNDEDNDSNNFADASEEFPFSDSPNDDVVQHSQSESQSLATASVGDSVISPHSSLGLRLRRRRSLHTSISDSDSKDSTSNSCVSSQLTEIHENSNENFEDFKVEFSSSRKEGDLGQKDVEDFEISSQLTRIHEIDDTHLEKLDENSLDLKENKNSKAKVEAFNGDLGQVNTEDSEISSQCSKIHETSNTNVEKTHQSCLDLKENEENKEKIETFRDRFRKKVKDSEIGLENVEKNEAKDCERSMTMNEHVVESVEFVSKSGDSNEHSSNFLLILAGLIIKLIGFQFSLLFSFVTFPFWALYTTYTFVTDPFQAIKRSKEYMFYKLFGIWGVVLQYLSPYLYEWLKEQKSAGKFFLRFGWGFLWSTYVCSILCGLLVSSFVFGGLVMRHVVEEPIQMKETLNFDYTKTSPVAFIPILACPSTSCGVNCREMIDVGKNLGSRIIPPNHKLQVTVSLVLPESEYNRNLGIFQVRVDFLSANGRVLASYRRPCMLSFKSQPIRLMLTFLKIAPLLTGYASETQTLNIKFKGFTEGDTPTSCLKVVIEQRAEFRPGAGIPEMYDATAFLESELPLLKRIIWYWKKTIFVWLSLTVFTILLIFTLLCCKPLLIPRARSTVSSAGNPSPQNRSQVQK